MKMIDKNGRLFGKISIIDVLVIAIVILMAVALSFKGRQTYTSTSVTKTPITYQVQVSGVRTYVADAIHEGDELYDQDYTSGGSLGEIISIEVTPALKLAEFSDGSISSVSAEDCVSLLLTVRGEGVFTDGRYMLNRVYNLGVNAYRNFYTPYVQFVGTVTTIQ
jgi:hypothetical protein